MMAAVDGAVAARLGQQQLAAIALILPVQMLLIQTANGAFGAAAGELAGRRSHLFAGLALGLVAYGVNNVFAVLYVSRVPRAVAKEA